MRFIDVTCTDPDTPEGKKLMHDTMTDRRFVVAEGSDPAKIADAVYTKEAKAVAEDIKISAAEVAKAEAEAAKAE